jgi:hypothetical protein
VDEHFLTVEIYGPDGKLRFEAARRAHPPLGGRSRAIGTGFRKRRVLPRTALPRGQLLLAIVLPWNIPKGTRRAISRGSTKSIRRNEPSSRRTLPM